MDPEVLGYIYSFISIGRDFSLLVTLLENVSMDYDALFG